MWIPNEITDIASTDTTNGTYFTAHALKPEQVMEGFQYLFDIYGLHLPSAYASKFPCQCRFP